MKAISKMALATSFTLFASCTTTGVMSVPVPVMVGPVERIGEQGGAVKRVGTQKVLDSSNTGFALIIPVSGGGGTSASPSYTTGLDLSDANQAGKEKIRVDNFDVRSWFSFTFLFTTWRAQVFTTYFTETAEK